MKRYNKKFNSLHELAAFINSTPANGWFSLNGYDKVNQDGHESFNGSSSHTEADSLMLGGWSDGAKRIQAFMASGAVGVAPVRRVVNSVVGFAPNVPAAIAGRPLNMRRAIKVNQPRRVVSIVYNGSVSCDIDTSDIEKNATKLFNVICGLERAGVRVELWVCDTSDNKKKQRATITLAVKIKSADQPLNVLKMCYPVVHPSFTRRHALSVMERLEVKESFNCYGYPMTDNNKVREELKSLRVPSDNIVSSYSLVGKSESEILKMIK